MPTDKPTLSKLKKFGDVFKAARERNANESDTVMYLIKFFEEVLGYDPLSGEITKEVPVKERYCDFAIVLNTKAQELKPEFLVEAKSAGIKSLNAKHIEQASNYAANKGVNWVVLTNGTEWHLYHLTFDNGIQTDLVFELNFIDELEQNPDFVWDVLSVLVKGNVEDGSLETYYEQKKLLSPKNVVSVLLGDEALAKVRQELNRKASVRLAMKDVFYAVVHVLSQEALAEAGDINPPSKKRKRHHHSQNNGSGQQQVQPSTASSQTVAQTAAEQEIPS
jgi:predicted type IV restriction endonuclease